jgi:hypothetical protein
VKPRLAFDIGVTFIVVAIGYYAGAQYLGGHVDFAGVTMLIALSAAMSMMFYVLMAGPPRGE